MNIEERNEIIKPPHMTSSRKKNVKCCEKCNIELPGGYEKTLCWKCRWVRAGKVLLIALLSLGAGYAWEKITNGSTDYDNSDESDPDGYEQEESHETYTFQGLTQDEVDYIAKYSNRGRGANIIDENTIAFYYTSASGKTDYSPSVFTVDEEGELQYSIGI